MAKYHSEDLKIKIKRGDELIHIQCRAIDWKFAFKKIQAGKQEKSVKIVLMGMIFALHTPTRRNQSPTMFVI